MIDSELIGDAFVDAVKDIAPCFLAEAEADDYPFIVYNQTIVPLMGKDGVCGLESSFVATIVSNDFEEAEDIAGAVAAAMRTAESMQPYAVYPNTINRDCTNKVWEIELTWTIRQHN
jgi:hypothetical protein